MNGYFRHTQSVGHRVVEDHRFPRLVLPVEAGLVCFVLGFLLALELLVLIRQTVDVRIYFLLSQLVHLVLSHLQRFVGRELQTTVSGVLAKQVGRRNGVLLGRVERDVVCPQLLVDIVWQAHVRAILSVGAVFAVELPEELSGIVESGPQLLFIHLPLRYRLFLLVAEPIASSLLLGTASLSSQRS